MTEKHWLPCSRYDIQGLQSWLDEMALQGKFFQRFSRLIESAQFVTDTPCRVRYRLDPVGKGKQEDLPDLYAQMGWALVDTLPRMYCVYSCQDPDAPELHSDPATLAYALNSTIQQQTRFWTAMTAASILFLGGVFSLIGKRLLEELILMEQPRDLFQFAFSLAVFVIVTIRPIREIRQLVKVRRTLAPKAGRRWNRARDLKVYFCITVPLLLVLYFAIPSYRPQVCGLGEAPLSHTWPTLAQLEAAGPRPLEEEPEVDGYLKRSHSWLVPVQEFQSMDWSRTVRTDPGELIEIPRPYPLQVYIQYDRARSPGTARLVYQLRRDREVRQLNAALSYNNPLSRVSDLQPFQTREYPGLDALETVRFRRGGQERWLFTALRGNDILVVEYAGPTALEDCLPLFLETLGKEN